MRTHHLVAAVLAVLGLVAPAAHAAGDAQFRPAAGKTAKKAVTKPARKNVRRATAKAAAQQPRAASRTARSRLSAQPARKPVAAARSVQLPRQTIVAAPRTDVRTRLTRPGDYRFVLQHDGRTRTYRVHVPPGLDFHEPAPLLVALHGGSVGEQANAGLYGLARESDRQRFVTVFPDAYQAPGSRAGWNAADAQAASTDDVGFIDKVVDNVFRQLSISRLEMYAAGMGDGGSMAYRLACERPHLFRAVASVGGADATTQCASAKPVSILHFQAKNDAPTVLASLGRAGGGGSDRGTEAAAETAARWAKRNGCMEAPQRILDMSGAYCEAYSYCRQQTEVRLCVTEGSQAWPGALKPGAHSASHAISATSTMWGFFSSR